MDLTLSQLECFLETLDRGSFTAAADALGISQPAVAEQIRRLELVVGQSLFARMARGVQPTGLALDLEEHARRVIAAVRATGDVASAAGKVGVATVTFGTFGSPHRYGLTELIRAFLVEHSGARVRVVGQNSSLTADAVRSGQLDAGVVALPIDDRGLEVRPLFAGEVFVATSDSRLARRAVTIEAFSRRPLILYEASVSNADPTRRQLAARAQAAGVRLIPRIEVESADTALELAALGLGDTYVPLVLRASVDRRLSTVGFDPPLIDTFALVVRAGARVSGPVGDFMARVTAHLAARVGLPTLS